MSVESLHAIWIALSAFSGAILLSLLGWSNSSEKFNLKKFTGSLITAVFAAAVVAATFDYSKSVNAVAIFTAVSTGAGADAVRKAVSNASRKNGDSNVQKV